MFYEIKHTKSITLNDEVKESKQIVLDVNAIQNGIIKDIGVTEFSVLLAIMSGAVTSKTITQKQIAECLGLSRPTVAAALQKLEEKRLVIKDAKNYTIVYETATSEKKVTPRDIISYFCTLYYNTYGVHYNPSWAKDSALIKNKLMVNYDVDTIFQVIDVVFNEYDKRWSNKQYPRPTISMLVTWLFNSALTLIQQQRKEQQQVEVRMNKDTDKYFNMADDVLDNI